MHNCVRMIAASFLTMHACIDWHDDSLWFCDSHVKPDPRQPYAQLVMGGRLRAGAAPYFRIFNPVLQRRRFDPDGNYLRRCVPQRRQRPDRHIHET